MKASFCAAALLLCFVWSAQADEPWLRLPPTPALPKLAATGLVAVNGARIWYGTVGPVERGAQGPEWVVLLHGGLANSAYMGGIAADLARDYRVLLIDSRGHGRSSAGSTPIGYDIMASDVLGVMDHLAIKRAALVGWSDGAIIGLVIARQHPERLSRLFAFAANSTPDGAADPSGSVVFMAYEKRAETEYAQISPDPGGYKAFYKAINTMWLTQPHFTKADLQAITVPTWIADGDHDEAILRRDTDFMAQTIPDARELILPGVSHFAFLQDPAMFDFAVRSFLQPGPVQP
jgi:pimeloyl-ACP methyl ester carboxylesterase